MPAAHPEPHRTRRRRVALVSIALASTAALMACQPVPPTTEVPTPGTAVPTTTEPAPPLTHPQAPPSSTTTSTIIPGTPAEPSWKLVAGDEFDATDVDGTAWKRYHNTYGDGNHELACLTPANVTEGGGSVKITARKETVTCPSGSVRNYTSGFLGSREVGRYFPLETRISVRAKLPHAQGLWPAAWLRHKSGAGTAEVDLMEYFHATEPGRTRQTLHLDGRHNLSSQAAAFEAPTPDPAWHVWTVEILKVDDDGDGVRDDVRFTFFVDYKVTHTYTDTQHRWADTSDPSATWDLALNLAVGGDWTGNPDGQLGYLEGVGRCAQGGTPPACPTTGIRRVDWTDPAASTYEIDYVHVYAPAA